MTAESVTFEDIEAARRAIRDLVYLTPFAHSATLSQQYGAQVHLKLENLHMTGSFKERGAGNKLRNLPDGARESGVIASSAGNHAQGVAYHATRLGVRSTIVMPEFAPLVKVDNTRRLGAEVILHGQTYDDAYTHARALADARGQVFLHPFDDPQVIAGQGTVGLELLEQHPYLDAVVVPVGGGGLIAGIACALKETNPRIKVYGVQAAAMPGMLESVRAGGRVSVEPKPTMADGIAVRMVGEHTLALVQRYVDDIVTVDEEEIAEAVMTLLEVEKTLVEGAGATPLAALAHGHLDGLDLGRKRRVGLVLSGGNIDVTLLSRIIDRGLVKSGRVARLQVLCPDTPGTLMGVSQVLGRNKANVLDISHDRAFMQGPLGMTLLTVTVGTRGQDHLREVRHALAESGYATTTAPTTGDQP